MPVASHATVDDDHDTDLLFDGGDPIVRRERQALYEALRGPLDGLDALIAGWPEGHWPQRPADPPPASDGTPQRVLMPHNLVHALGRNPAWKDPSQHPRLLAWLDRLVAHGETVSQQSNLDDEPGIPEFSGRRNPDNLQDVWDRQYRPPLQWAAIAGHLPLVDRLLHHGANVGSYTGRMSALHYAVLGGHLPVVNRLIEAGAPLACDWHGHTPLHTAMRSQSAHAERIIDRLIDAGVAIDPPPGGADSALYQGMEDGPPLLVLHLLRQGADLNRPHRDGTTPLVEAERLAQRWHGRDEATIPANAREEYRRNRTVLDVIRRHQIALEQAALRAVVDQQVNPVGKVEGEAPSLTTAPMASPTDGMASATPGSTPTVRRRGVRRL